jgi:hypothetical protein
LNAFSQTEALTRALALYRQPVLAHDMKRKALPEGITDLLRIAAEGEGTAERFADVSGSSAPELYQAAILFLQTIVFHQSASDLRLLALSTSNDSQKLRDHKRLILKWLHPDRNPNSWESKLFLRVQAAAKRLETAVSVPNSESVDVFVVEPVPQRTRKRQFEQSVRIRPEKGFLTKLMTKALTKTLLAVVVLAIGILVVTSLSNEGRDLPFANEAAN